MKSVVLKKQMNRKCTIYDSKIKDYTFGITIINLKNDRLCERCAYQPTHHPYGCNM